MSEITQDVLKRLKAAQDEVSQLCAGDHKWRMCIPVQPTDSDVVISSALNDVSSLVDHVRALEADSDMLCAKLVVITVAVAELIEAEDRGLSQNAADRLEELRTMVEKLDEALSTRTRGVKQEST